MKKLVKLKMLAVLGAAILAITSCKKDKETPLQEGIERSELIFTEVGGLGVEAHGNHFHGLANAVEGTQTVVKFNQQGKAIANGHLHLEPNAIYKVELKAWDYRGKEVQNDFIKDKATADQYKAFLIGGNLMLNASTTSQTGAIFQPRELTYGDQTDVSGAGGIGTTGVISYFTVGEDNKGATIEMRYVLRKLNTDVKATITRNDWNRMDYANVFGGQDVLNLRFEVHPETH